MPFSVLLLTTASSSQHITGVGQDKVIITKRSDELVLCFDKLDVTDIARQALGLNQKCCDGIIFYACGALKVICLVEMKHSRIKDAADQIKATRERLYQLLKSDCNTCKSIRDVFQEIIWRAYVYRSASILADAEKCRKELEEYFAPGNIAISGSYDITDFLRDGHATRKRKGKR